MSDENDLEPRIAAIETCLIGLMVEHFRHTPDPVAALDRLDHELQDALQASREGVVEIAVQQAPEQPREAIEQMAYEAVEPHDMARMALLARVRKLLLQG
jgi:hypothetical protein